MPILSHFQAARAPRRVDASCNPEPHIARRRKHLSNNSSSQPIAPKLACMRLAFICSSLEPGKDGVGDYCRRMAGALIRQGHSSVVVALNDPHVAQTTFAAQEIEGASISVMRLPSVAPWSSRAIEANRWLETFKPDWLSLQFVIFGFHPKGLCFGLGKHLAGINSKASWHVMFHELWLGLGQNSPLKHRVTGALQRRIILDFMRRLRPRVVHTQTDVYRTVLGREKITASLLPLISNVPFAQGDGWTELLEPLVAQATGKQADRTKLYLAGVFGAVYPEWNPEEAVNTLFPLVDHFQKRLVLVFLGRSNLTPAALDRLKTKLRKQADVVAVGERTDFEISKILQALDLGLATTPRQVIQKSGSVAAMLNHGLRVLVIRDDWRLAGADAPLETASPRLISPKQFALLTTLPGRDPDWSPNSDAEDIARTMLETMTLR